MLEIINPNTEEKLVLADADLDDTFSFDDADNACKKLGTGWRLPNNEEFLLIYNELHLNNITGLQLKKMTRMLTFSTLVLAN